MSRTDDADHVSNKAAVVTTVTNSSSGQGRTPIQVAAAAGLTQALANEAAELGVKAGTLERIEGGSTPGIRYAVPGKGL